MITYSEPFIIVRNGHAILARTWRNADAAGIERAENWQALEQAAQRAVGDFRALSSVEGAYPALSPLAEQAEFKDIASLPPEEWITLTQAARHSGVSISGLVDALSRGRLDYKIDLSGPRSRRMVRTAQLEALWPSDSLGSSGARIRWRGKQQGLSDRQIAEIRFWRNVEVGKPHECWPWRRQAGRNDHGRYGVFWLDGKARPAHRVAYELQNNETIPEGVYAKHRCNNSLCCNPRHIYKSDTNR